MDAQHDFIVTCGYSVRTGGVCVPDAFVNVFNLKTLAPLPPIPFPPGAAFVRMHPRMVTTSIVISLIGMMHVVDLVNVNTSNVRMKQANVKFLSKIEIAPSGQAIALADAECNVQLWGPPAMHFAEVSNPIEYHDQVDELLLPEMDWSVNT